MMLSDKDFELPLEKQLRMRVIDKEIDECSDVSALKENLKLCSKSLMRYQHLVGRLVEKQLMAELELMAPEVIKIVDEITGIADGNSDAKS